MEEADPNTLVALGVSEATMGRMMPKDLPALRNTKP
jgi:hypothetical protein